jgi:uncharacterized protein YjiS (DUF1127 family)
MRKTMMRSDLKSSTTGYLTANRAATSLSSRLQAGLVDWYQIWQRRRQDRQDLNHIARFDAHLLRDIGLTAADVADMERESHGHGTGWNARLSGW